MRPIYFIGWLITRTIAKIFYRLKIFGIENFPNGKVIIAPNHISLADPPIIGCCIKKELNYMAKKELFENKFMDFVLRKINAFPVTRENVDKTAIKNAIKILKNNKPLVLFPQGTRNKVFAKENIKLGFIKIAKIAQADILPVAIVNTDKLKLFKQIKVFFATPIPYWLPEEIILQKYIAIMEKMLTENN
jgi:1-acyl-sn-glycerol-3-phosphate acyltransferase